MASPKLTFSLYGEDKTASKAIKGIGESVHGASGKLKGLGTVAGGVFGGIMASAAAGKVADFAKDSMNAFQDVGRETMKLQRYMGGSAEDASRLASAFTMTGVDAEAGAKGLGILSKHLASNDKAAKGLGIALRDSSGHLRPMSELLPQIADKFKDMKNGPEKTALAMSLFGKAGAGMIPFLNKGSEGLKDLAKESDELGTTLSGKDLDAVKANTLAKRQFGEAVKGLQISVGRELYPAMTALTKFMSASVLPVVRSVIGFMREHKEIVTVLAAVIGTLVVGLGAMSKIISVITSVVRIFTAVQTALNIVMAMNPVMLIVIAVVALVAILVLAYQKSDTFRAIVQAVWGAIQNAVAGVVQWFQNTVVPALKAVWDAITNAIRTFVGWFQQYVLPAIMFVVNLIIGYYRLLWTIITVIWKAIAAAIGWFVNWFRAHVVPIIRAYVNMIIAYYRFLWSAVQVIWNAIKAAIDVVVNWFQTTLVPKIRTAIEIAKLIFADLQSKVAAVWSAITSAVSSAWSTLSGWVEKITSLFTGIASTITSAFNGIGDGIAGALKTAWNKVADLWNGYIGGKSFTVGPITLSVPTLPRWFAEGGIVTSATLGVVGEAGPEAIIPLSQAGRFGIGGGAPVVYVTVNAGAVGSKEQLARTVVDALRDAQNRGLKLGLS